jgi:hypothetical protein
LDNNLISWSEPPIREGIMDSLFIIKRYNS